MFLDMDLGRDCGRMPGQHQHMEAIRAHAVKVEVRSASPCDLTEHPRFARWGRLLAAEHRCPVQTVLQSVLCRLDHEHAQRIAEAHLDVAVGDAEAMAVVDRHDQLLEQSPDQRLIHAAALHAGGRA